MEFESFESLSNCVGCGSTSLATTSMPDVSKCRSCGLLFRSHRPTQTAISKSYDLGENYERWEREEETRKPMWERRVRLLQKHHAGRQVLDVGTGDGRFLTAAAEQGFLAAGTEISTAGAALARKRGFNVLLGQFSMLALPHAPYDVVTAWHVLEHVPDPGTFLLRAFDALKPGGLLFLAVPNESRALVKARLDMTKGHALGELPFGGEIHLTHFQPRTLIASMRRAGFEVVDFGVDYIYHRPNLKARVLYHLNLACCKFVRWHLAPAMFAVGRRS